MNFDTLAYIGKINYYKCNNNFKKSAFIKIHENVDMN